MKFITILLLSFSLTTFLPADLGSDSPCYTAFEGLYGGYLRNNPDGSTSFVVWKRDNTMQAPKIISDKITGWDCGDLQNWAAKNNLTYIAPR